MSLLWFIPIGLVVCGVIVVALWLWSIKRSGGEPFT